MILFAQTHISIGQYFTYQIPIQVQIARCKHGGNTVDTDPHLQMEQLVQSNTGLTPTESKLFHLEMWAYVHGIATMFATGFLDIEWELVSQMLTDSYMGLCKQYERT